MMRLLRKNMCVDSLSRGWPWLIASFVSPPPSANRMISSQQLCERVHTRRSHKPIGSSGILHLPLSSSVTIVVQKCVLIDLMNQHKSGPSAVRILLPPASRGLAWSDPSFTSPNHATASPPTTSSDIPATHRKHTTLATGGINLLTG